MNSHLVAGMLAPYLPGCFCRKTALQPQRVCWAQVAGILQDNEQMLTVSSLHNYSTSSRCADTAAHPATLYHTVVGRIARAGEHLIRSELKVKVLLAEEAVHEHDELQDQLVLTQVISRLEHHLTNTHQFMICKGVWLVRH